MQFRDIFDLTVGRLYLPKRAAPPSTAGAEMWLENDIVKLRKAANDATMALLSDANFNVPGGVPQLGTDGKIPAALLSTIPAGSGGSGSQSQIVGKAIGEIWAWGGDPGAPPQGALVCDGAQYLRADFPTLFSVVKTRFGRPSNDLYFRVPDLRLRNLVGSLCGSSVRTGGVYKVVIVNRGRALTPGSYAFTFEGGTYSTPAQGLLIVENESVPTVGTTGVVARVEITVPGSYTTFGSPSAGGPSNVGVKIPESVLPASAAASYEVFGRPVDNVIFGARVTNHGSGYTSAPAVSISGPSMRGATGYAIVNAAGRVAQIVITNPGIGDPTGATIAISGGGGASAAASIISGNPWGLSGDRFGESEHVLSEPELATHTHVVYGRINDTAAGGAGTDTNEILAASGSSNQTSAPSGSSHEFNLMPPGVAATYLIQAL